jgi:catalase
LSKVVVEAIRARMLSNLVNVDPQLARRVAAGLNMDVPEASPAAAPVQDLELSPALRIIGGPLELHTLQGRSVSVLVADGSDVQAVRKLAKAIDGAGGRTIIVAPKVGGATMADGMRSSPGAPRSWSTPSRCRCQTKDARRC